MTARTLVLAAALLSCALAAGCGGKTSAPEDTASPQATGMLIASRGAVMPLAVAVRQIGFVPFIPSEQIAAVAAIPPLSDAKDRAAPPGLAIEYESHGDALLLSQWPRAGLNIAVGGSDVTDRPCAPVAYRADGLLWTTRNGRVMTLQPDGIVDASRIWREADRLLHAGACGRPARTFSRPRPTRSRAVSLPPQSVS